MKYRVTKTYKYTENVLVEADSESDARKQAMDIAGDKNFDEELEDIEADEISDEDFNNCQ